MGAREWRIPNPISASPLTVRHLAGKLLSNLLILFGIVFLVGALTYAGYTLLQTWLMGQDRFLMSHDLPPLAVPAMTWTPSPTPSTTPTLTPSPTPTATLTPSATFTPTSLPTSSSTPLPTQTPSPTSRPTLTPSPTPTASLTPAPTPRPPSPPVKIRIPSLDVNRSIIKLPRTRDRRTGSWIWKTERLFRAGRKDLVGHLEGSDSPGEPGNMILAGHNYGYGYNGVFVHLGRLRPGKKIYVVNKAGVTFTYRVTEVDRVRWRKQNFAEITEHLRYLSGGGSERLTLVSCSGADFEPFPERIYVVAEPVR